MISDRQADSSRRAFLRILGLTALAGAFPRYLSPAHAQVETAMLIIAVAHKVWQLIQRRPPDPAVLLSQAGLELLNSLVTGLQSITQSLQAVLKELHDMKVRIRDENQRETQRLLNAEVLGICALHLEALRSYHFDIKRNERTAAHTLREKQIELHTELQSKRSTLMNLGFNGILTVCLAQSSELELAARLRLSSGTIRSAVLAYRSYFDAAMDAKQPGSLPDAMITLEALSQDARKKAERWWPKRVTPLIDGVRAVGCYYTIEPCYPSRWATTRHQMIYGVLDRYVISHLDVERESGVTFFDTALTYETGALDCPREEMSAHPPPLPPPPPPGTQTAYLHDVSCSDFAENKAEGRRPIGRLNREWKQLLHTITVQEASISGIRKVEEVVTYARELGTRVEAAFS